jgi:hypothetical protein
MRGSKYGTLHCLLFKDKRGGIALRTREFAKKSKWPGMVNVSTKVHVGFLQMCVLELNRLADATSQPSSSMA